MQKLAHVVLKRDELGNTVQRKYVTPAELMFLVADSKDAAKGDPVIKIDLVADDAEELELKRMKAKLEELIAKRETFSLSEEITEEVRESRVNALSNVITNTEDRIARLEGLQRLRTLEPDQEVTRLCSRYHQHKIVAMFPGGNPSLPATHEAAIRSGLTTSVAGNRFIFQDSGGVSVPVLT